jgi:prepilin-type N-terminal cleavage/methylation domain-containing protein/prepilin-type processing-associated H-X9-DG protein
MNCRHGRGFTLIEMLIVITIIGLLAAFLMTSLSKAKDRAKATTCTANLKNFGTGIIIYTTRHEGQYPKLTPDGHSQLVDAHGINLLPVEAVCRMISGDLIPAQSWLGDSPRRALDRVAMCPAYPRDLLRDNSDYNPNTYSYNRHVDGDGSTLTDDMMAMRPAGTPAHCCMRTEGNTTTSSDLCLVMDSADTGVVHQPCFSWSNVPDNVSDEGSLPNRHNQGANLLFADGHVEWKTNVWLRDKANARQWVCPAAENSGAWAP